MRPVNLIPPEERRGEAAPGRTGAARLHRRSRSCSRSLFVGVARSSCTDNDVNDKQAEVASLEAQAADRGARRAPRLLRRLPAGRRTRAVDDRLAREEPLRLGAGDPGALAASSRQRLADEPDRDRLAGGQIDASSRDGVAALGGSRAGAGDGRLRPQPAGRGRGLISAVGDIDGVTRVLVEKSEKAQGTSGGSGGGGEDCRTRSFIAQFNLVAAFDAVPAPAEAVAGAALGATTTAASSTTTATPDAAATGAETTTGSDSAATAVPEETQAQDNVKSGTDKARKAAGLVGAGDGG